MNFKWHPEALDEFEKASFYYRSKVSGLDDRFEASVRAGIDSVVLAPQMWPYCDEPARRRLIDKFPYSVIYVEFDQFVVILAVMHNSRDPEYWKHRLD